MRMNVIERLQIRAVLSCAALITAAYVSLAGVPAQAQGVTTGGRAEASNKKPPPLPRSGTLSRSITGGYSDKSVNMIWGEKSGTEGAAPISGSVSKVTDREWTARVFNNSEDVYSANLQVIQFDANGTRLKQDSFSVRLSPGEKSERSIKSTAKTADAQLNLTSWKNLTAKEEKTESTATIPEGSATTN